MFLNKIKDFWIKKIVKKRLSNVKHITSDSSIKNIGILFDESYFKDKQAVINELIKNGVNKQNIHFLVFRDKIKKNETFDYSVFSYKDISWSGTFEKAEVNQFVNNNFDLLINYYDTENAALILATNLSKASFKVGFASVDNRLNHFLIDTHAENYLVFMNELIKYLKILNKL